MCKRKQKKQETEIENIQSKLEIEKDNNQTNSKKQKKSFFKWLGGFVTKRYKIILIISVLSLASAIYPAFLLTGELKYNDQDFLPNNLDSNIGDQILDEQFDNNISKSTTIIVLDSDELISSDSNLEFIRELTEGIYNSSYNDMVARVDSIVSTYEEYNSTYWAEMDQARSLIYDLLLDNITYANAAIHQIGSEINTTMQQIAGLYTMTWFNFSRAYYYGLYNSDLFTLGSMDPTVLQSISLDTNFTNGYAITPEYVNLVYFMANSLGSYNFVNDQIMHDLAFSITNSTLFQVSNMTIEEYQTQLYPLLQLYYQNWLSSFQSTITGYGVSIVNGTLLANNLFDNSTLFDAYVSQGTVLGYLQSVNSTAFQGINVKEMILSQASEFFDFSDPQIMDYLSPEYLSIILELIYDLGPEPSPIAVQLLTAGVTDQIITNIQTVNPPITSVVEFCTAPEVSNITRWFLSTDGQCTIIQISYDVSQYPTLEEKDKMLVEADAWIGEFAHSLLNDLDMTQSRVYHTGEIFITENIVDDSAEAASKIDIFAIVFVLVALLLIFTSFVAPLIPLITIGVAIVVSFAFLYWVSQAMDIHYLSTLILTIISLGAGVDYCIFIYSRYDEELKKGVEKEEAVKIAIEHAGESVLHSGLTVMVGFGALIIPNFPLLRCLGIAMLIGISFSIMASLLIVPSLLMALGDKIYWPKALQKILRPQKWFNRKKEEGTESEPQLGLVPDGQSVQKPITTEEIEVKPKKKVSFTKRLGKIITKNGLPVFIISLVAVAPMIYFTTQMKTSTDFMSMMPSDFEPRDASDILGEKMDFGNPIPVQILFTNLNYEVLIPATLIDTEILCVQLLELEHVKTIRTITRPLGTNSIPFDEPAMYSRYLSLMDDFVGKDNHTFYIDIYLDVDPYSDEANDLVSNLSNYIEEKITSLGLTNLDDSDCYILGVTSAFYEMNMVTSNAYPIVIPVVIAGVFLILLFLFGSFFTPIRLIITIGMSIAFTLGMLYLIYGVGFSAPIFFLLPIMLFSILMGLGLDYDIFLVSRIKEYCQAGMTDEDAIINALEHTGTIITSCGLVMAAAFSSLMFTELWHISELGFAFTIAILLDATVVRLILVPSIMMLFKKFNWTGPKRLQKVHRKPEVTAIMKILGDNIGIEIYSRELKESLDSIIDQSKEETDPEELIEMMMPTLNEHLNENNIILDLKKSMVTALQGITK